MERKTKRMFKNKERIPMVFAAVFVMGFFVSIIVMCNLGTDPCTFMNRAICSRIGMSFGNWQLLLNCILFIIVYRKAKDLIGFGTIFNMVLIGYYVDFFMYVWNKIIPKAAWTNPVSRWIIYIVALFCFIVSAAVYINSDTGVAPYDAMPIIIANAIEEKTGNSHKVGVRMCWDACAILMGILFGSIPVIGVILMTIFLGPVIGMVGKIMGNE